MASHSPQKATLTVVEHDTGVGFHSCPILLPRKKSHPIPSQSHNTTAQHGMEPQVDTGEVAGPNAGIDYMGWHCLHKLLLSFNIEHDYCLSTALRVEASNAGQRK